MYNSSFQKRGLREMKVENTKKKLLDKINFSKNTSLCDWWPGPGPSSGDWVAWPMGLVTAPGTRRIRGGSVSECHSKGVLLSNVFNLFCLKYQTVTFHSIDLMTSSWVDPIWTVILTRLKYKTNNLYYWHQTVTHLSESSELIIWNKYVETLEPIVSFD